MGHSSLRRTAAAFALIVLSTLLPPARAHAFTPSEPVFDGCRAVTARFVVGELLATPVRWLLSHARLSYRPPAPPPNSAALRSEEGWSDLRFEVGEHTVGVFFEVAGRVEFDRAALVYEDGETETVDLRHRRLGRGLYELAAFGEPRGVREVRVHARAAADEAWLGLRLGR